MISSIGSPTAELITEPLGMSNWLRMWKAESTASSAVWLAGPIGRNRRAHETRGRGEIARQPSSPVPEPSGERHCAELACSMSFVERLM